MDRLALSAAALAVALSLLLLAGCRALPGTQEDGGAESPDGGSETSDGGGSQTSDGGSSARVLYDVTELGTLGGDYIEANGINEVGQVVGVSQTASGANHAYLWQADGGMVDLGSPCSGNSRAFDINNHGRVAGNADCQTPRGFFWENGQFTLLELADGGTTNGAYAINDDGDVVGWANATAPGGHTLYSSNAALWKRGGALEFVIEPNFTGGGTAKGINAHGQIIGYTNTMNSVYTVSPFLWENGQRQPLTVTQNIVFGPERYATGINDSGQVVGWNLKSRNPLTQEAWFWENNQGRVLGDGAPAALNARGEAVGRSGGRAQRWRNGHRSDLNDEIDPALGWVLREAQDINSVGQIVGAGLLNGKTRAFLLTPRPAE
jgi:probable HAF family extracellular repeat protein